MIETVVEILIKTVVIVAIPLAFLPIITLVERRGAAFIQRRLGPNRVGPFGLLQPLADVAKFMFKEEVHPSHVKDFFYPIAPLVSLVVAEFNTKNLFFGIPFYFFSILLYFLK